MDFGYSALVQTGLASTLVKTHEARREIGIGSTMIGLLHISDPELGCFSTDAGLVVGDATSGNITVGGISAANSDTFATLQLVATHEYGVITFDDAASSFNKGIVLQATRLGTNCNP